MTPPINSWGLNSIRGIARNEMIDAFFEESLSDLRAPLPPDLCLLDPLTMVAHEEESKTVGKSSRKSSSPLLQTVGGGLIAVEPFSRFLQSFDCAFC